MEQAIAMNSSQIDIALSWHKPSKKLIEKPLDGGTGILDHHSILFFWADSCHSPPSLSSDELAELELQKCIFSRKLLNNIAYNPKNLVHGPFRIDVANLCWWFKDLCLADSIQITPRYIEDPG